MRISTAIATLCWAAASAAPLERRDTGKTTVSAAEYADLVRYTKFAAAALAMGCTTIYGATKIADISNTVTDTQGYVARDDTNKQIIIALRGTSSIVDVVTDASTTLVTCVGTNIPYTAGTQCHLGFMTSYNSVSDDFISTVKSQLAMYPDYSIFAVGHSLGGGLVSFAALSMKYNFPNTPVTAYSFGQPRSGNKLYADFHDASFPNITGPGTFFRGIHTSDGVPQVIRQGSQGDVVTTAAGLLLPTNNPNATSGFWHHGKEVWQFQEPATSADTVQCTGQENPNCQDSLYIFAPILGINSEHLTYFGQSMTSIACPAS